PGPDTPWARELRTAGQARRGFRSSNAGHRKIWIPWVGQALIPRYTVYCSWLGHKAKPCFWFTRYLPGISLNDLAETAKVRPDGVLSGGVEWLCPKSSWLKTTPICGAFWSRRCRMPVST